MTEPRSPGAGPSVCPFVALAEDRDRRADSPDEGNRCYAEPAPRRRDLSFQADYCYSPQFSTCSVFLAWAARNAAEPAHLTEAAQKAWASGVAAPESASGQQTLADAASSSTDADADALPAPSPEGGLFGPADPEEAEAAKTTEQLDWVSASAWAEAPWDERAELEADELEALAAEEEHIAAEDEEDEEPPEEATQAPKVPAALPMRRRKPPQKPIRSRGSGEWFYADPPGREPLVSRRRGITPPILLAVLALLVVSIIVFLLATQLGGDGDEQLAAASPSPQVSLVPVATRAPVVTERPTAEPSITPQPKRRFYRVKAGDTLSGIAAKLGVEERHLQCINGLVNKNIVVLGARYEVPPENYTCPPGWRKDAQEP